jgi:hypothetical protein
MNNFQPVKNQHWLSFPVKVASAKTCVSNSHSKHTSKVSTSVLHVFGALISSGIKKSKWVLQTQGTGLLGIHHCG